MRWLGLLLIGLLGIVGCSSQPAVASNPTPLPPTYLTARYEVVNVVYPTRTPSQTRTLTLTPTTTTTPTRPFTPSEVPSPIPTATLIPTSTYPPRRTLTPTSTVTVVQPYTRLYVPAVAFPTVYDSVRSEDLRRYWLGDETVKLLPTNPILYVSPETHAWLTELWGAPGSRLIQVSAAETIPTALWKSRTKALAILPIEQLTPSLKVLAVDAFEPLSPKLNRAAYPLKQSTSSTTGRLTNYDPTKSTVLVMTGVTALTRATAYQMEKTGIELPARDILPFLADAHIVHTSNEVSFAENCPDPSPYGNTTFCSKDEYFDLLKAINLRVVELTGNHGNDYGRGAFLRSLDLYEKAGIIPFGGGRTLAEAQAAVTVVHHGNAFAFIGCNPVGPAYAWAKKDQAGAATCDLPYLKTEIQRLKAAGYIVIMTIQYQEYYFYGTTGSQAEFFGQFADWGADLVMGSQAHTPQGFALTGNTFIHYGIGNLFFDQMDYINTRQMFIDKLYFYEGRLISVGLFTGLLEDFSRPRPMTDKERGEFLNTIFKVSGW